MNFHDLMPGYRVFQVRDSEGEIHFVDTDTLADGMNELASRDNLKDQMKVAYNLMKLRRNNTEAFNEMLQSMAEIVFAKDKGVRELALALSKVGKQKELPSKEVVDAIEKLAKAVCDKMMELEVSPESVIRIQHSKTKETHTFSLRQIIGGFVTSQTDPEEMMKWTERFNKVTSLKTLSPVIDDVIRIHVKEIANFDINAMDRELEAAERLKNK